MPNTDSKPFAPRLSPKGQILFNIPVRARTEHPNVSPAVLCSGSVFSTKTWSVADLVLRHLWETPGARFVIFALAVKVLTDAGPWKLLTDYILPEWCEGLDGFEILSRNREGEPGGIVDSKTRTVLLRLRNMYGGTSELQLNSIQYDDEIEAKLLSTFYSGMWFSELKLWKSAKIFKVSRSRLRMPHLQPWQHLWIADTNPPKEGRNFWAYKIWFEKAKPANDDFIKEFGEVGDESIRSRHLIQWTMDDNVFASEEEKEARKLELADDPLDYKRDALGEWVHGDSSTNKLFSATFNRSVHVIGDGPGEKGQIELASDTDELYSGMDIGEINHAGGIIEKRTVITPPAKAGDPPGTVSVFSILKSLRTLGEEVQVQEFTHKFMAMQKDLLDRYPRREFRWTYYADDSAINQPRGSGAGFDYLEVLIASENKIVLTGVPKPKNSVGLRIRLVRRLLREQRLYVSAECEDVIAMFEEAENSEDEEIVWNMHKHVFDWISYVLWMLCFDELEDLSRKKPAAAASTDSFVSVPLG